MSFLADDLPRQNVKELQREVMFLPSMERMPIYTST